LEASQRDSTAEWLLPAAAKPPLIHELAAKVEEALATARASESAVMTVGAAALDAAEQAKRAAELAERASVRAFTAPSAAAQPPTGVAKAPGQSGDESLLDFNERADRLAARLRQLERPLPLEGTGREAPSWPVAQRGR
jgi:hypothetical protein